MRRPRIVPRRPGTADYVQPEHDEDIRTIKDLAAGAVLFAAGLAAAIGVIVFWPYVID